MAKILSFLLLRGYNKPEVFEYEVITNNILNGKGFLYYFFHVEQRAFIQPFYPVFTAIVYYLTKHSQIAMLAIQSIASSALCFIVYNIAVKLTDVKQALLCAALVAFHPGLTIYSVLKLHPLTIDAFFYLLAIAFILRFIQKPGNKNAILTGSFIGLALLCRSTILIFIIFSLIYAPFILHGVKLKNKIKYIFLICFFAVLVYSPWIIRNYRIFNTFVFMQTSSGENLLIGNNKLATGSAILKSGQSIYSIMPEKTRKDIEGLDELGQSKYCRNYFISFIKKEPLLFLKLSIKKFYYFWWFGPQTGALYNRLWLDIYKLYYTALFFFFIAGLIYIVRKKSGNPIVIMLFFYMLSISLLHAFVNVDTRHRWLVEPVMIIFSSIGFFNIVGYLRGQIQ